MFKSHPISSYLHMIYIFYIWLEVLNNLKIWKSDWIIIPTIGEKKTCSKPPTKCYINYINPSKNQLHISCLHHIYLGRLKYFTNLNLAAIWWWVSLIKTMISRARSQWGRYNLPRSIYYPLVIWHSHRKWPIYRWFFPLKPPLIRDFPWLCNK